MGKHWEQKLLSDFFKIRSGDYHATAELDKGDIPLISCGDVNNGLVGLFNIPPKYRYNNCITVAYNGQPLTAKYHPYYFGTKDDVAVLHPLSALKDSTLLYVVYALNRMQWRYSYGRKCFKSKMEYLSIPVPIKKLNGLETIDEKAIEDVFSKSFKEYLPQKDPSRSKIESKVQWEQLGLSEIFDLVRGDFHSLSALDTGDVMTISRLSDDNGVVGYYNPPDGARIYTAGTITISTVDGSTFVQLDKFIATDNVIVCNPNYPLSISTLFFLAFLLNRQKWRYSYGRQCYLEKAKQIQISVPVKTNGDFDEKSMENYLKHTSYWKYIDRHFRGPSEAGGIP